jgi:hypothetical protein
MVATCDDNQATGILSTVVEGLHSELLRIEFIDPQPFELRTLGFCDRSTRTGEERSHDSN